MSLSDASLKADAIDHVAPPTSPTAAERRGLTYALIAAAALHLLIPVAILVMAAFAPHPSPPIEEIPVEVVVEKPPPPPKPPEEKPKPPPQPEDEKPAYDAPSAATAEKANQESPDKTTSAPETSAEKSQTPDAPEEAKEPEAAQAPKAQAAPTPQETPPSETADMRATPTPATQDADSSPAPVPAEKPSPPPAPRAKAPPGTPIPSAEVLPDYKIAHAATESPIVGGDAETRYFTIVYGMIRAHMRRQGDANPPKREGAIVFALDETGNLLERRVVMSSGSPNLDMSVMNAISEAAPYPAPPGWQPRALRLTYGR